MDYIFEITDKSGRKIRLTKKQWTHISEKHPAVTNYFEEIKETLATPDSITESDLNKKVRFYYNKS